MGVTLALPFLEAMVPARTALAQARRGKQVRFVAIEMVHGVGRQHRDRRARRTCGRRPAIGRDFDLSAEQPQRRSSRSATT